MKKRVLKFAVMMVAVMMLVGGCALFGGDQGSPEKVVEAYFKAFQAKDFQEAMNFTVNGDVLSETELENLEMIFDQLQIKKYEIGKADRITDDEAIVPVTITTVFDGDESVASDDVRVLRIDGKWYVDDGRGDDDDDWDERDVPTPDRSTDIDLEDDGDLPQIEPDVDDVEEIDEEEIEGEEE